MTTNHLGLGKKVYENEHCAVFVHDGDEAAKVFVLRKDNNGKLLAPLGFIQGYSSLTFEYV